jgi:ribosomal protein S27AE
MMVVQRGMVNEMKCKQCGSEMTRQAIDEKTSRLVCGKCGLVETVDQKGRQLLTGEAPLRGKGLQG